MAFSSGIFGPLLIYIVPGHDYSLVYALLQTRLARFVRITEIPSGAIYIPVIIFSPSTLEQHAPLNRRLVSRCTPRLASSPLVPSETLDRPTLRQMDVCFYKLPEYLTSIFKQSDSKSNKSISSSRSFATLPSVSNLVIFSHDKNGTTLPETFPPILRRAIEPLRIEPPVLLVKN